MKIQYAVIIALLLLIAVVIIYRKKIFVMVLKPQQEGEISLLHKKAQPIFKKFISRIENETDYNVIITDGYRTFAEQAKQHEIDPRNPEAGQGYHPYGMGIDINASNGTTYLRKSSSKQLWIDSGIPKIAQEMNLRWGGNFSNYYDPIHFDLGNYFNINTLYNLAIAQFGTNWNNIEGNQVKLT